ncbi:hypothetical protein TRSC58_06617 [Trypanosoma rangeli SC58]|uniref:RanBP2-type domain-containing protein n=1 Tax=Trypanosoma rangeli SC58 TaxID=429131 RepID=A0A061IXH9_TRYRA|nr:hypothetical protein TRSC58_06617 [Trypanosoma rangeli SC58]
MVQERSYRVDHGNNTTASTMVTDVFLMAPLARKVSVYVRRASSCEGVQLLLVPRASAAALAAVGEEEESKAEEPENDGSLLMKTVWFEPHEGETHEILGGCDAVVRYKRNPEGSTQPCLQAEFRVETSLGVDGRWVVEIWNTLSGTQMIVAEAVLQRLRNTFATGDGRMREESLILFRNGLLSQPRAGALPTFVKDILVMDEAALRRRVPCRQSDVRAVRATLSLIGMFLAYHESETASWESHLWQDAVKRVGLASSLLGKNPGATEMATFVLEHVALCHLSMPQIVEGTIALLTSSISVGELRNILSTQRTRAELCVLALSLLLRAKENFVPKGMFYMVSLLRDFMMCEGTHYLWRFRGCGESMEEKIRELVHQLLTTVFTALHRVMSLPEGKRERHGPHRFLLDTDDFGPFAIVTLSLLASPLDARDIDFVWCKIASQLEGLLPNFTDFTRSASFKVSEMEEVSMLEALQALVNDSTADHEGSNIIGGGVSSYAGRGSDVDQPSIGMTMTGASERGLGVWVPTGRERVCSTSTPLYTPGLQVSPSCLFFTSSSSPSSSTSRPLVRSSLVSPLMLCVAAVQLASAPSRDLIVALATKQQSGLTASSMKEDSNGFYFSPHNGILHHNDSQLLLIPLFQGDTIAFAFSFVPKTSTRVFRLLVNGVCIAEFPAPRQQLFLLAGVTGLSNLRNCSLRVCFPSQEEMSSEAPAMTCGNYDAVLNALPTRHSISVFATNVFFYLISLCAKRVAQFRRQRGTAGASVQAISSVASANRLHVIPTEEVWRGFVDGCCNPLRQNIESLVDSIARLPPLSQINDATERVKRNAASFVYHRFLMDYITMTRTVIRSVSSPVEMLSTLSKVVCCEDVGERERCAALTIVCSLLCEPHRVFARGTYNPLQLWDCCRSLSRCVTTPTYQPVFTAESAAAELTVCSGGRRIKSGSAPSGTSRAKRNTTSFASQGIPLDGSLGEVVAFSVRLQRGFLFDTLGRFYYVGLACPCPMSSAVTLSGHPGEWQNISYTYTITDYFTDISSSSARAELPRHAKHWMSNEENIIFGSGDVITVIVHTKLRCISFERNGLSLGTLYTNIPPMVKVLFPFVELFNKDATALWMYPPREIGIRARFTMRAMLYHWGTELVPRLNRMLRADDVVALQVLGADGDEMSFWYRSPPRSELKGSRVVHLVRQIGSKAEVVVEGGAKSMTVLAVALEPNYNAVISNDLPVSVVVEDLLRIVFTSISFTTNAEGCEGVRIQSTKVFLCALRLLSEMEMVSLLEYNVGALRALLVQFIRILGVPDTIASEEQYILLEAWNELLLLPDDDALWIPLPRGGSSQDDLLLEGGKATEHGNADGDGASEICLRCPTCDAKWSDCASEGHMVPYSLCFTQHCVLQRLGVPSPFTGFVCEWSFPGTQFCVTIRVGPRGEMEGEGEETRGLFTFTAKLVSNHFMRGSCVYKGANNSTARAQLDEEWACELCTFINLADSTRCAMCTTARSGATWTCVLCGYAFNSKNNAICTTCGHRHMGASDTDSRAEKKLVYCEGCGSDREYTTFDDFDCHAYCGHCQRESRWLPDENYTGLIEATLVGAGDTMDWKIILGDIVTVYEGLRNNAYSLEGMQQAAAAVSPTANDLSRYVPPLVQIRTTGINTSSSASTQQQQEGAESFRAVVPAILFFCSRIVCRWGPEIAPHQLSNRDVLRRLRVVDDGWLAGLEKVPYEAARGIFFSSIRVLLAGTSSGQVIRSLSSVARVLMNSHASLQNQRHYLLYALCMNVMRCNGDRAVREVCYAALNKLIEAFSGRRLNASPLRDVVAITPIVAEQQRLMVHASLRGVDVCTGTNVISTSWLIKAVERMERCERLPAIFDEPSPDIFPYLVELPDTRMGDGGELIVGQVRGSVGVLASKGGRYYYEVVIPANIGNDRSKTIVMGWGTMQHEVLSGGQHVGSDIHSWGFNCQDRLRVLTGEQAIPTPRPIVGSDVIGALLDLDTMMMCWSLNGEQLMWVTVSTQGKGEAIYPFVSASVDPFGVVVRLGYTQFKPDGYEEFSPFSNEMARRKSHVKPQSYEFYVQLCNLGNDLVNCGFTLDALLETSAWFDRAQALMAQYPLLAAEVAGNSLERLRPYLQHLRSINFLAISVAKSHDILRNSPYLMRSYQKTRQLLFFSARWAIVERQIERRLIRSSLRHQRVVMIDLNRAKAMSQSSESLDFMTRFEGSITGQLFRQTKDADIYLDSIMFVVSLAGEVADDAGGVTRSVVTMMCDELNYREEDGGRRVDPMLPFFRLTGHTTMVSVVPNMEFYRENPEHRLLFVEFFTWLGKLLGNATMSGYLMFSLTFPRLTWKFLTFDTLTIEDYYTDIDDTVRGALNDDAFLLNDDFFYSIPGIAWQDENATDTLGMVRSTRVHPLQTPGRSAVDLTTIASADDNEENVTAAQRRKEAEQALLHQYDELLLAMLSGITFVIPVPSLQLIRWDDLQQRVCGNSCTTAEDAISSLNLSLLSEELRHMLKEVLRGWTPKQRSQFLLFCSGQRRIPLPEKVQVTCGDDPEAVPTAHTCSPISLLLHPYSSVSVLRDKLEVCLRHVYEFGFA